VEESKAAGMAARPQETGTVESIGKEKKASAKKRIENHGYRTTFRPLPWQWHPFQISRRKIIKK
jgi:hypothetical protein